MPNDAQPWFVRTDPATDRYAFFLSHVAKDKPFVLRVKQLLEPRLRRAGARLSECFIDVRNWPHGRPALWVLQDAIFASAHVAVFVTPAYLEASRRSWTWIEFAFAYLIETSRSQLHPKADPFIVPLFET